MTLLQARQWSGAYYIAGYAVECGLKACIARQVKRFDFPDKDTVNASHKHAPTLLVKVAGLEPTLGREVAADPAFQVNWAIVKDWSEESRYVTWSEQQARDLLSAITDPAHGVLRWVRRYW